MFSPRKMGISLNPDFDTIVIGAGLFGSACAKHIGLLTGDTKRICLIGPEEPQDRADTNVCQQEICHHVETILFRCLAVGMMKGGSITKARTVCGGTSQIERLTASKISRRCLVLTFTKTVAI